MTIQKIKSGRVVDLIANDYIGSRGQIFYNETVGDLRLSDGQTMGGIPLQNGAGSNYILPISSPTQLGGVKIGNNIFVDANGVISVADAFSGNYNDLSNKPNIPTDISQLTDTTNILSVSPLIVKNQGTVISSHSDSINFTGVGITATAIGNDVTVSVETFGNLDGGLPFSVYGGITPIDGGSI